MAGNEIDFNQFLVMLRQIGSSEVSGVKLNAQYVSNIVVRLTKAVCDLFFVTRPFKARKTVSR